MFHKTQPKHIIFASEVNIQDDIGYHLVEFHFISGDEEIFIVLPEFITQQLGKHIVENFDDEEVPKPKVAELPSRTTI